MGKENTYSAIDKKEWIESLEYAGAYVMAKTGWRAGVKNTLRGHPPLPPYWIESMLKKIWGR